MNANREEDALQIVHARHWWWLSTMSGLALVALGYLIFGRIPLSVEGNAMLLTPGTVVSFESTATGQIARWYVHAGDRVAKGDLLVRLDQPLINKQLEQARQRLADLEARNATLDRQEKVYLDLERDAIARKKQTVESRIDTLTKEIESARAAIERVGRKKQSYLARRQADLGRLDALNRKREEDMSKRREVAESLREKGLRSEDDVLRVQREQIAQDDRTSSVQLQQVQGSLDQARAAELLLDSENRVTEQEQQKADLEQQLQELIARDAELGEQAQSASYAREIETNDVRRAIARLEEQLGEQRDVRSEYDGRIVELATREGELASKGMRLGSIDTRGETAILGAVAYFKMKDGKKVVPGMTLRVTPAVVEEARFGGVLAKVISVSEYPVTVESLTKTIGNREAALALTKDGRHVEVQAELLRGETRSGYQWERFGGPDLRLTAGTVGIARANTREVRPIEFVIPLLEEI